MLNKLVDRANLFLETWHPFEFHLRAWFTLAFILGVLFLVDSLDKKRISFKGLDLNLFSSWVAWSPLMGSMLLIFTHTAGFGVTFGSATLAILGAYFSKKYGYEATKRQVPMWAFVGIWIFYLLSVDHNFLPPQFDVTTYQFIGNQLFKKGVYPGLPFAENQSLWVMMTPGYYSLHLLAEFLWSDQRRTMILASFLFLAFCVGICRLGRNFFKESQVEWFVLLACFSRGLFFNYWEFNLPRQISVICCVWFCNELLGYYRSESLKVGSKHLFLSGFFLLAAFFSHPENSVYLLGPLLLILLGIAFVGAVRRNGLLLSKAFLFLLVLIGTSGIFLLWYHRLTVGISDAPKIPINWFVVIPKLFPFLVHSNGFFPLIGFIFGSVFLIFDRNSVLRKNGFFFLGMFGLILILSYYALTLNWLYPEKFPATIFPTMDDFSSGIMRISGLPMHPVSVIFKITGLWWWWILPSAWCFWKLWNLLSRFKWRIAAFLVIFLGLMIDVSIMYYNRPVMTLNEFGFLEKLKPMISMDSVVVGPPGPVFSPWLGPILDRDSLSFRSDVHVRTSMGDLQALIRKAYLVGDFNDLKSKLPNQPLIILIKDDDSALQSRILASPQYTLILSGGGVSAFRMTEVPDRI